MADIQLGRYTIKSHGAKLARLHMYDWITLVLLAVMDGMLNIIEPFHRFVGKDMMTDLRYPLKGNTVPFWAVPLIGIVLPCAIFGGIYFKKKNVYDLHHGILGILYSVLITAVITDAVKDGVGRPRPDFFWRCFPDGKDLYDNVTTGVLCHGEKSVMKEGYKSFPSGHSSLHQPLVLRLLEQQQLVEGLRGGRVDDQSLDSSPTTRLVAWALGGHQLQVLGKNILHGQQCGPWARAPAAGPRTGRTPWPAPEPPPATRAWSATPSSRRCAAASIVLTNMMTRFLQSYCF